MRPVRSIRRSDNFIACHSDEIQSNDRFCEIFNPFHEVTQKF